MKALAGLLCVLLAGCVAPQSSSPSASPSSSITFWCDPTYCSDVAKGAVLEGGVLTAVAGLGYPVQSVSIGVLNLSCGVPDPPGTAPPCPPPGTLPKAYVNFVGTNTIAVVELGKVTGGPGTYSVVSVDFLPGDSSPP